MKVKSGGRELEIDVKKVRGLGIFRGLMFRRREKAPALLFNLRSSLHSLFVFFPFVVLWLDSDDKIVDSCVVRSWKFRIDSDKRYSKIVEIPISRRYRSILDFVVGKRFKNINNL
tara:strand:+ start:10682 stop:11026 length:345 start_codon:yes stop_codon:yes gene_type:complete